MADGGQGFTSSDDSGAHAPGAVVRNLAAGHGWTSSATAQALERDPHTIGRWASTFGEGGPVALIFGQTGVPPALGETQQAELRAAVHELPDMSALAWPTGSWFGSFSWNDVVSVCNRSSCLNYLHRLEFAFQRPKKRLVKADAAKRESFVAEYAALWGEAGRTGAKIFFADEAHFRADAELRGKWVLKVNRRWRTPAVPGMARRPAITRRCAWRRGRWNGWNWRGTATEKAPWLSWNGCGRGTAGGST